MGTRNMYGRSRRSGMTAWAKGLFHRALQICEETTSPRTWAFGIMGVYEYLKRVSGDRDALNAGERLSDRLMKLYDTNAKTSWLWFENTATYENARLPQALILHGRWSGCARSTDIGFKGLALVMRAPIITATTISTDWIKRFQSRGRCCCNV